MTTALITHPDGLAHVTPSGHPERVDRLVAINAILAEDRFESLMRVDAPMASREDLALAHPQSHIDAIEAAIPATGQTPLDADTYLSPGSWNAASRAAGGNVKAVDMVLGGEVQNAFVAMRPPGHHAERETPMGFCLFGSAVIGARHALERHGLSRIAIVDFDVHHGNGTQDLVWDEERILFASTHQMPLYPGSGHPHETGAHGQIVNVPLAPNTGGREFRQAMERIVLPAVAAHRPDLIIISAGFDAHRNDPLANLNWDESDFAWATEQICALADEHASGRVVSTLEGGYDLDGLAASVAAHVEVLMERGA